MCHAARYRRRLHMNMCPQSISYVRAGLLLLLVVAQQQQVVALDSNAAQQSFTIIPDIPLYPPVAPVDVGYPANLPAGLPFNLPQPSPVLSTGPATGCQTTVRDVLVQQKRNAFIALLSASASGRSVLDGKMAATIMAPTDAAIAALHLYDANNQTDPAQLQTIADYHVLQGKLPLQQMLMDPGRWLNTSLTKASCPTAFQTLTVLPGNGTSVK